MSERDESAETLRRMVRMLQQQNYVGVVEFDQSTFSDASEFTKRQLFGLRALAYDKLGSRKRCIEEYTKLLATNGVSDFESHTTMVEIAEQYLQCDEPNSAKLWLTKSIEIASHDTTLDTSRAIHLMQIADGRET
ncbi:hypothetical protein Enr13x_50980 [Stieleria neptunia]|uniref:Tetratricopeptide repeat protein n=1 Tax=Stieleria neptunia TaxID=2527979 RepID=A0A518HWK8_9BACT|nr:hypothetical protein [Stieleria neptunia]QDV45223.1 hypothetical protein Enr13x_50980 [Stieleria neptunia]